MRKQTILFLAANPARTSQLGLGEEAREIEIALQCSKYRDSFHLETRWAARPLDLLRELRSLEPTVVHFAGHGGGSTETKATGVALSRDIIAENDAAGDQSQRGLIFLGVDGRPHAVSEQALRDAFGAAGSTVKVVVLNACYSEAHADALITHVDCIVGMSGTIRDDAARSFAIGFYGTLGDGGSIAAAFRQGRAAISLEGQCDSDRPQLRVRDGVDASKLILGLAQRDPDSENGEREPRARTVTNDVLQRVEVRARDHRKDLSPETLSRVPRAALRDPYARLEQRLRTRAPAMHYVVGEAGCGKSTALGEVFDLAPSLGAHWRLVVPCSSLRIDDAATEDDIDRRMGASAGTTLRLSELCARLTTDLGAGVVLIDTLDLVVSARTGPAVRYVLGSLVEAGAHTVGVCRTDEFRAYLAAKSLREQDTWPLATFEREEMVAAARMFASRWRRDDGSAFAAALEALTAGEHRLDAIARQPVLLSILCDLFAEDGHVPADLTVAALYRKYWAKYVEDSRRHGRDAAITHVKERICLRIAEGLIDAPGDRMPRSDVVRDESAEAEAYKELRTDGVLRSDADGGVHFFHQTLLEYAKARWLTTRNGAAVRERLIDELATDEDALSGRLRQWPVVRQVLAILDDGAYTATLDRLPLARIVAFRNAALAAGSRSGRGAFAPLVPFARSGTDEHRRQLLASVDFALSDQLDGALDAALSVLTTGTKEAAVNAAKSLARLCLRGDRPSRHAAVVEAIKAQYSPDTEKSAFLEVLGYFLAGLNGPPLSAAALDALWTSVVNCGGAWADLLKPVSRMVDLHLVPGVERAAQLRVLRDISTRDVDGPLIGLVARLVGETLPDSLGDPPRVPGDSLRAVFARGGPAGWSTVWAKVAGFLATSDEVALRMAIRDLLCGDRAVTRPTLIAMTEAIRLGAGVAVALELLAIPTEEVASDARKPLVPLLRDLAPELDEDLLPAVRAWAAALGADGALSQLKGAAPRSRAPDPRSDDDVLAEARRKDQRTLAREASRTLLARVQAGTFTNPGRLLCLLRSKFTEVRLNALEGLAYMTPGERADERLIEELCELLRSETHPQVLQGACRMAASWASGLPAWDRADVPAAQVPAPMGRWLAALTSFVGPTGRLPTALADAILATLTTLARHEPVGAQPELSTWAAAAVRAIPFDKGDQREKTAEVLLPAVHRHDGDFLATLVDGGVPSENSLSVAVAVSKCVGNQLAQLRQIARAPWCSTKALNFIQVVLGA